jgi:hypothetical protein
VEDVDHLATQCATFKQSCYHGSVRELQLLERGIGVLEADAQVYAAKAVTLIAASYPGTLVDGVADRSSLSTAVTSDSVKLVLNRYQAHFSTLDRLVRHDKNVRRQLDALQAEVSRAVTDKELLVAWFAASPYVHELVLTAIKRTESKRCGLIKRLRLINRTKLIQAIAEAIKRWKPGRPPLRVRPRGAPSPEWCHEDRLSAELCRAFRRLSMRQAYHLIQSTERGRGQENACEGALVDLMRDVSTYYELPTPLVGKSSIHRLKRYLPPRK